MKSDSISGITRAISVPEPTVRRLIFDYMEIETLLSCAPKKLMIKSIEKPI